MKLSAVVLVGGPTGATQFRPLSLDIPKPLFPIAGKPMIYHHIAACSKVKGLEEVIILGGFTADVFSSFIEETSKELNTKITYIDEGSPMGTAGALFKFQDSILGDNRDYFFLLHSDICCTFPLQELLDFHVAQKGSVFTMMGTKVDKAAAPTYGCYVSDEKTNKMLHYAEHPETYISDTINAGVYIFSPEALTKPITRTPSKTDLFNMDQTSEGSGSMERDVIPSLANEGKASVYLYKGFWRSIKNAGGAVYANEQYISHYAKTSPALLTSPKDVKFEVVGGVIVHPTATVDPTAKLGPNVYVGPNAKIGRGVRISHAIILNNVNIKDHACVLYSIVSDDSIVGQWTRLEGIRNATAATVEGHDSRFRRLGITVFGKGVSANSEIIVRNCVVMPHKGLTRSVFDEIIL
eukprot:TRINITY_DN11367_c0_g1_i1.p1 TRINITY_DN11367_c0_g1~~TRINITY_DN11367_c0_g1_i1.p1  ORF type:complete len:409 (+),score=87.15 TRINITY_DN11367_c0_g1_i1:71-1297(+)